MMVVTNNKTIIGRRLRRIRKMKAVDASSNFSNSHDSETYQNALHDSEMILHNIDGNWSTSTEYRDYILEGRQRMIDGLWEESEDNHQLEDFWSEDVHDIYENGQAYKKIKIYHQKKTPKSRDINIQGNFSEM